MDMKTVTLDLYTYDELDERAKQSAINWWLELGTDWDWWQSIYDDAERACIKITSFDEHNIKGHFIGSALDCMNAILKEHGEHCETYKAAMEFEKQIDAAMDTESEDIDELESEFLRAILEEYRIMLRKEYEYITSDKYIAETLESNGYTFTKEGKRHD